MLLKSVALWEFTFLEALHEMVTNFSSSQRATNFGIDVPDCYCNLGHYSCNQCYQPIVDGPCLWNFSLNMMNLLSNCLFCLWGLSNSTSWWKISVYEIHFFSNCFNYHCICLYICYLQSFFFNFAQLANLFYMLLFLVTYLSSPVIILREDAANK